MPRYSLTITDGDEYTLYMRSVETNEIQEVISSLDQAINGIKAPRAKRKDAGTKRPSNQQTLPIQN